MSGINSVAAIILAAGKGTRMKSSLPKVLHSVAGKPILKWVVDAVKGADISDVALVLSPETSPFQSFLEVHSSLNVVIQSVAQGTGDAVASAAASFEGVLAPTYSKGKILKGKPFLSEWAIVVTGDTPAISSGTIKAFLASVQKSTKKLAVLGMNVTDPRGYGRLVRNPSGGLLKIVEERDADSETKKIKLCNSGIIACKTDYLFQLLGKIAPHNSQNEYYLTDIFSLSNAAGESAHVFETNAQHEFAGVNDRVQLESMESYLLETRRQELMLSGVTLHIPQSVYIEADVEIEQDVAIYSGVSLMGRSKIYRNVVIGAGSVLSNVEVGAGAVIGANCTLSDLKVALGREVPAGTVRTKTDF